MEEKNEVQLTLDDSEEEITIENVQFYSRHAKELKQSQITKARKFVEFNCLRYIGNTMNDLEQFQNLQQKYEGLKHVFICLPLNSEDTVDFFGHMFDKRPFPVDYNHSEYIIYKRPDGMFSCNCQGWVSKEKKGEMKPDGCMCSHVLALFFMFRMKKFGNHQGNTNKLTEERNL